MMTPSWIGLSLRSRLVLRLGRCLDYKYKKILKLLKIAVSSARPARFYFILME
jgi:hypothetical protein